jgi:hypothetical protein
MMCLAKRWRGNEQQGNTYPSDLAAKARIKRMTTAWKDPIKLYTDALPRGAAIAPRCAAS